ncbi:hypothetical protein SD960_09205 [Flavobacterium sp. MMLR14_040]|uniref:hypothetical protein n=1 Tax=Flavobacterium sp. MMLR14_040 TaxID=3093843 RepID=UPI00298FB762|nr:hypothetical protein [Flavobacterium sp. MMLR14_040]MDW8850266.1 hypothetical protein [Flavobacterium sp. MMLR14_040]
MKENNINKNLIGPILLFAILFLLFFLSNKDAEQYDKYKKTLKGETIGFATRTEKVKRDYLKYYFYSGRKILSETSIEKYNGDKLINKFYKIKYNINNPEENYIVLEEELEPDSISLVKAGFTKIKYYFYDAGVTCKYIEKSKWK